MQGRKRRGDIIDATQQMVPVTELNRNTAKVFDRLQKSSREIIIIRNNKPAAYLVPIDYYNSIKDAAIHYEDLMEIAEDRLLARQARAAKQNLDAGTISAEELAAKDGWSLEELIKLADEVEIE